MISLTKLIALASCVKLPSDKIYVIMDPNNFEFCNALQTRLGALRLISVFFNSDALAGLTTTQVLEDPQVWLNINSNNERVSEWGAQAGAYVRESEDDGRLSQVFTDLLGLVMQSTNSGDPSDVARLGDYIDDKFAFINATAHNYDMGELGRRYIKSGLVTPLVVVLPTQSEFDLPETIETIDWIELIRQKTLPVLDDYEARVENSPDCTRNLVSSLLQTLGSDFEPDFAKVQGVMNFARGALENIDQLPSNTLGGIIRYFADRSSPADRTADASHRKEQIMENVVAGIDLLFQEITESGSEAPINGALNQFWKDIGCGV